MLALDGRATQGRLWEVPNCLVMSEFHMCHCGCPEDEHRHGSGRCLHCGECEGFEYDEEGTIAMLNTVRDHDLPI